MSKLCDPDQIRDYVDWVFTYPGTPWPGNEVQRHVFWLRRDCRISISLPMDLTNYEAERLGMMLKSLPI